MPKMSRQLSRRRPRQGSDLQGQGQAKARTFKAKAKPRLGPSRPRPSQGSDLQGQGQAKAIGHEARAIKNWSRDASWPRPVLKGYITDSGYPLNYHVGLSKT